MAGAQLSGVSLQEKIFYTPYGRAFKNTSRIGRLQCGDVKKPNSSMVASPFRRILAVPAAVLGQKTEADNIELERQVLGIQDKNDSELTVPILSTNKVIEKMEKHTQRRNGKQAYRAMYSSIFGGITIDPTLMVIPLDDHMVHRGHGVFDTALIVDGWGWSCRQSNGAKYSQRSIVIFYLPSSRARVLWMWYVGTFLGVCLSEIRYLYELDPHLDRLLRSASMAKITAFDRSYLRSILVQTVAASQCKQGSLRYWLTAGPGDFFLSPSQCPTSAFYAVVIEDVASSSHTEGVKVVTSSVPMKPPQFATMKNVNYLPNALSKMEAEERGCYAAIWFDDEGFVAEGPNMNVAFINKDRELLMPSFEKILSGCTAKRILHLVPKLVEQGVISSVRVGKVSEQEGRAAEEMMLIGSGVYVTPVVMWDEQPIGNGKEGPVTLALLDLLLKDMKSGPLGVRVPVPY